MEEVKDKAAIGIMSDPTIAGGLPASDIDVPEIEGEREYDRPSFATDGGSKRQRFYMNFIVFLGK